MSIHAMNWAWAQKLAPTQKLILMAIADSANDCDECWPGIRFMARKCCVSERTIQRTIQKFEASGLISMKPRFTSAGRQTSNGYRLCIATMTLPDKSSPSHKTDKDQDDNLPGTGVTSEVTVVDDNIMSPLESSQKAEQQPLHFPTQLSNSERISITDLILTLEKSVVQALLDELADALETASIKTSPLRWFRGLIVKQKNGEFVPAGGVRIEDRRNKRVQNKNSQQKIQELPRTDKNIAKASLLKIKNLVRVPQKNNPDE
ncbi:helix-turn-helix domain-containing protein [Undibacterium sp.]|uniref:helix-turn-helix domain-containing protein n=1 Tax=Undibacterium sp. TaxID=1914977 RepID=UPI0025FAF0D5|nr:helix-turn-helix domain-containing protein [Undibacterium sp.]